MYWRPSRAGHLPSRNHEPHWIFIDDEVIGDFLRQCLSSFTVTTNYFSANGTLYAHEHSQRILHCVRKAHGEVLSDSVGGDSTP